MGSLMSGWSSTVLGDDKRVRLMRNRSLTREDVDAFWRQRGRADSSGQSSPLASPRRPSADEESSLQQQQTSPFEARRVDAIRSSLPSPLARGGAAGWSSLSSNSSSLSSPHYDHDDSHHHQQQRFYARSEPSSPAAAPARRVVGFPGSSAAVDVDSPSSSSTSRDWWTVSSWAFLNETPYDDDQEEVSVGRAAQHKAYDACDQFHVARIVTGNA